MGVKGAFTSAGFDTSSIKRFGDQLAHISVYYEYRDQDLYINDATIPKTQLASATMDDANSEFALGEAVFLQNGSWAIRRFAIKRSPMKIWAYCQSIWV